MNAARIIICLVALLLPTGAALGFSGGDTSGSGRLQESVINPRDGEAAPPPQRIIPLSPGLTEIVFALGAGSRVAGVSDFTFYPPEAREKPLVGGWMNPNLERLVALAPDLVLLQGEHETVRRFCRERGIRCELVNLERLEDIQAAVRRIGGLLGLVEAADSLVRGLEADLAEVRARLRGRPPVRVLLVVWRRAGPVADLQTATGGNFLDEALEAAGGVNVFGDLTSFYPRVSLESLVSRAPEIILDSRAGEQLTVAEIERLRREWDDFPSLPAVAAGRVHVLTEDYLLIPGPRVSLLVRRLAELLHPEADEGPRK